MTPCATAVPEHHVLSGWGGSVHGWARVWRPGTAGETAALLRRFADEGRPVTLRGAGRSYGDAALHAGADVIDTTALRRVRSFDPESGVAEVEGGVTIEDLWRTFLPRGWWPAVVPGTMYPTVAGALSMNVHGKNHFAAGGFGEHADEIEVALTTGELRRVRADSDAGTFRAVTGGLGLLGAVTAARLRLHRVRSGRLRVTAFASPTLEAIVAEMERRAPSSDSLVGWVDCFDGDGRGVVHAASHLSGDDDPEGEATLATSLQELPPRVLGVVPRSAAAVLLSPLGRPSGMQAVNAAKYRAAAVRGEHSFLEEHVRFAFLLDFIPGWKRIYEPGGLLQYQSFVPRERAVATHAALLRMCREHGVVPWLGVLKKHRSCPSLLAHAVDGYSLAMDFPVTTTGRDALYELCRTMDEVVLASGGRFYCAKDQTATPESFRRSYPALPAFLERKRELDPAGVLTSDLARRLEICA